MDFGVRALLVAALGGWEFRLQQDCRIPLRVPGSTFLMVAGLLHSMWLLKERRWV